jgi:ketosteroid isomerase-like protein
VENAAVPATDDLEVLRDLNRNYVRAAAESDWRWYADNLAEDYQATNPDGSFVDKAGFLAFFKGGGPKRDYEAVDVNIRVLGEVALIHSGFVDRKADGKVGHGRYTDIYARRDGRWLCVCAHFVRY